MNGGGGIMDKKPESLSSDTTQMSCGHRYSALAMFEIIKAVVEDNNKCEIRCEHCNAEFIFKKAARAACLSKQQKEHCNRVLAQRGSGDHGGSETNDDEEKANSGSHGGNGNGGRGGNDAGSGDG